MLENDLNRLKEIDDDIMYVNNMIDKLTKFYDNFIMNKNYYIKKYANKKISKYLILPLTIVGGIIFGVTAVTSSKLLLLIIMGNIISMMVISGITIKYINNIAKEDYKNVSDKLYDILIYHKKEMDRLIAKRENIINKNTEDNYRIENVKYDDIIIEEKKGKIRELRK